MRLWLICQPSPWNHASLKGSRQVSIRPLPYWMMPFSTSCTYSTATMPTPPRPAATSQRWMPPTIIMTMPVPTMRMVPDR